MRLRPERPADVTVLAVGGMSLDAERAMTALFEDDEILVDLFLPTRL